MSFNINSRECWPMYQSNQRVSLGLLCDVIACSIKLKVQLTSCSMSLLSFIIFKIGHDPIPI
jgi:hypothetical protein